ncbi:MAG TPA: riboflavin synthase [Vicinamibacterales bacterium]
MFTGLIEAVGRIRRRSPIEGGVRLEIETDLAPQLQPGDSLATNGVCLTVVARDAAHVATDVSPETLRATSLGGLVPGSFVNLERPLRPDTRLGGHIVQGHVDGTGTIERIAPEGEFYRVQVGFPADLAPYFVPKGSVAVDGISLTIAALRADSFDVQIIPHTWTHTSLSAARPGDRVNLECDLVGKYVVRLAELHLAGRWPAREPGAGPPSHPVQTGDQP